MLPHKCRDSLSEYISGFERKVTELNCADGEIDELEVNSQLLAFHLELKYQNIFTEIDVLLSQAGNTVSIEFVKNKFLSEEHRHKTDDDLPESKNALLFDTKGDSKHLKKFPCKSYNCKELRHKKSGCPKNKKNSKVNLGEDEVTFITCQPNEKVKNKVHRNASFNFFYL